MTTVMDTPRPLQVGKLDRAVQYDRDGVILVPGLLSTDEVDLIRETFTSSVENDPSLGFDDGITEGDILRRYPRYVHPHRRPEDPPGALAWRYLLDRRIFDVVEELVGPAWGAQSMFYFKPPTARGQALHQDDASLRTHPEACIAAWIAIDTCDDDNGSLMVVPGSHREDLLCLGPADVEDSFTGRAIPVPEGVEVVSTTMQPGDVLFFHGHLVHGSHRNRTTDRFRRSLIFHYVPQTSTKVHKFYDPLIAADGSPISIDGAEHGGPCGWDWEHLG